MRESQVKGKLARFMAGMRAYVRSQEQLRIAAEASAGGRGGSAGGGGSGEGSGGGGGAPLPPALTEFVVWAGDFLAGEQSNSSANGQRQRNNDQHIQSAASKYLGSAAKPQRGPSTKVAAESPPAEAEALKSKLEDCCSICLEEFGDAKVEEELGEVVRTSCGHHFHAVCIARHLESSENDPWW